MSAPRSAITIASHIDFLNEFYDSGKWSPQEYRAAVGDLAKIIRALDEAVYG